MKGGKKGNQWSHSWPSAASLWHSGTVWHLLSAGLPPPSLPLARCSQGRDTRHLRHQDSISEAKIARMLARALRSNYRRSVSRSLLPRCLISPSGLSLLPLFLSSSAAPLASSSVHEPGRHVVGPAEQHVGVVSARLGLVRESVGVVQSFQRGVDVVVVPARRVP